MKILMVGFHKLARMPYVKLYLDALADKGNEVHLLYWNRDEEGEVRKNNGIDCYHEVKLRQDDQVAKITKIPNFLRYRKFAKRLLRENSFELLIVMHTIPAILLWDELRWRYSKRYILDFRDLTLERFALFRAVVHSIAVRSAAVLVSSDAFRSYLPVDCAIYTSPNLDLGLLAHRGVRRDAPRNSAPIRIRYWGLVRHEDVNRAIIDRLGNDPRFQLHYHGSGEKIAERLERHVADRGISNVHFHGAYLPDERYAFAVETDVLLNVYENDATTVHAMGNKFYDGIALYLPQLCNAGSYMGSRVAQSKVGLAADPFSEGYGELINAYYQSIAWGEFEANCDQALSIVIAEHQVAADAVARVARRLSRVPWNFGGGPMIIRRRSRSHLDAWG
jgi:Glycosyl transferase 4-like